MSFFEMRHIFFVFGSGSSRKEAIASPSVTSGYCLAFNAVRNMQMALIALQTITIMIIVILNLIWQWPIVVWL